MNREEEVMERRPLGGMWKGEAYEKNKKNDAGCDGLSFDGSDTFPDDSLCRRSAG